MLREYAENGRKEVREDVVVVVVMVEGQTEKGKGKKTKTSSLCTLFGHKRSSVYIKIFA